MLCTKVGCDREANGSKDMCRTHYRESLRGTHGKGECALEGCSSGAVTKGLCNAHYQQRRRAHPSDASCSVEECAAPVTAKGMCEPHYRRSKRAEKGYTRAPNGSYGETCTYNGCGEPHYAHGLCQGHYDMRRYAGALKPLGSKEIVICSVQGCETKQHSRGLCQNHYRQMQRRLRGLKKVQSGTDPGLDQFSGSEKHAYVNATPASSGESALLGVVRSLLGPDVLVVAGARLFKDGRSVDVYVPSLNIAIEFNGLYWHSDVYRDKHYHVSKTCDLAALDIRLIHVWEDDWTLRRDTVIRSLASKLGASADIKEALPEENVYPRLQARRASIIDVSNKSASMFMDRNHIQGHTSGGVTNYGLLDERGVLRAVMQFAQPKSNARRKQIEGRWELVRYATRDQVVGGFTKLLKHALRSNPSITEVVSFADLDISDGRLYEQSGFTKEETLPPGYKYVVNRQRVGKESFQRKRFRDDPNLLWDESWTESQAAEANGLRRVWDSGKVRYLLAV